MSDVLNNTTRGVMAEFIVGSALGLHMDVRRDWDTVDLVTPEKLGIEVKSAAYVQAWAPAKRPKVTFDVRPVRAWQRDTNAYDKEPKRQAHVYVFALLTQKDPALVKPLDLSQWEFYVVGATKLNHAMGVQKSIALARLRKLTSPADYSSLAEAVRICLQSVHSLQ